MPRPREGVGRHAAPDGAWFFRCTWAIDMALLKELSRVSPNPPDVENPRVQVAGRIV